MALHVPMLWLPSVNQEFAFAAMASYFRSADPQLLGEYFSYQANSIGFPWLMSAVAGVLQMEPTEMIGRLLSMAGIPLLACALVWLRRSLDVSVDERVLLLVVLLNPIVWTYAGRSVADFLPAALGCFGLALCLRGNGHWRWALASALVLAAACLLKYHVLILAACGLLILLRSEDSWLRRLGVSVLFAAIVLLPLLVFVWFVHARFGFWFTPPRFQQMHAFGLRDAFGNLAGYSGYLVLLALPFSLPVTRQAGWRLGLWAGLVVLLFVIGVAALRPQGELNFGPLDALVRPGVSGGLFAALSGVLLFQLAQVRHRCALDHAQGRAWLVLVVVLVTGLALLALSRPSQRYLLLLLPWFILLLPMRLLGNRLLLWLVLPAMVLANLYIATMQYCTGSVAWKMAEHLKTSGLVEQTDFSPIEGHVGSLGRTSSGPVPAYRVQGATPDPVEFRVMVGWPPLLGRSLALVKLP